MQNFQFCYVEIKKTPTKVGGKQYRWVKQSIDSSNSEYSERLLLYKEVDEIEV